MSEQVIAQAHLTIIDNNDIESITVEYARNQSTSSAPTSGWSTSRPAWAQGYYIWQRTRIHKSGTQTTEDTFGTAVCLTGSTGQTGATGKGITGVETLYATNNSTTTAPTSGWQSQPPTYNSSKPKYWVKVTTTYNSGDPTVVTYLDNGITDAMATAAAANQTANNAKDKADTVEGNLNNYITSNNNVVTALQTKTKYFWTNLVAHTNGSSGWTKPNYPVGTYAASGISGTTFDEENSSTYGYNTLYSNGIKLRYNAINLGELTGTSLVFYRPSTTAQGSKGMELTSSTLKFYDATGTIAQATFGGTQAIISGTINAYDGKIGNDTNNYWYIGNYTDYNQNDSAIIKSKGTASIQLDETNTWRISTNRIHTAWAPETGTDAFKLHFPKFNDSSSNNKYWDYGLHLPVSNSDKFLYIRNASGSETLDNLLNDLDDNGYNYWNYLFWVDALGNVHAPGFYIGNSTTPIGGGTGTVAERLTQGYGSATQPIYFNSNGTPTNTTYTLNAAGAKGVDTSIAAASTSTNLPTSKAVAAFVEGKGYKTTDQNVKTEQANTTKIYLVGTSTTGTNTGTLKYDSGVYVDTTAGALKATTFNGYILAAASAKGVDTSIAAASTSTNLPTSQAVAAFVEGKGYKTTDNNTTYTFANGTNGFTVTPSGGEAQTVTVTPSISNNITGTGTRTSGYLAKFSGTNTITNGPALGTDTTKFLNNKGEWAVPAGTYTYTLPLATSSARGGVQIGYTQSGKNYPVQLSSEKMYVNVPWENTTYSAGTGLSLSGTTFNHSNSVTAGTAGTSSSTSSTNRTIDIPYVTYDAQGHVTGSGTHTHTIDTYPEAYLAWGGRNISSDITPVGMSISTEHSANRIAYLNPAAIQIEYTTNGGSTWTNSGYTDGEKTWLCTGNQNIAVGQSKSSYSASTALTTNHWTRITLTGQNGSTGYVYTNPRKLLINVSTALGINCLIEYKTGVSDAAWQTFGTYAVSGWSGWNDIPLILNTFGGGTTQTSNNWYLRFTFKISSTRTDNYKGMALICGLRLFGTNNWGSASSNNNKGPFSSTGHLYSYDVNANATFPAKVTATGGFSGNVTGTATGNVTSVQYDSTNKKITYTKNSTNTDVVTVATLKTDLGSMPASDVYSWAKASTKPSYSYSEIGSAPDAIVDATVNSQGVIVLTKNSGGTVTLSTEIAVVESQGANKLVEAGTTTGISVGSAAEPVYFSSGVPVKGNTIPKLNNTTTGGTFYAPTAVGTAKQILVSSGNAAPTWQTVATGGTNGTFKIGSDEYAIKGLAAAAYKALADSSSASAIGTGTNVTTERDVYYGLPTINNAHNYTSSTTIYAPTTGGTTSQVLIGNGTTSAPVWTDISGLVPTSATNATNDSDGNPINTTYIKKSIGTAAGDIIYWSASGTPTRLAKGSNGQVLKLANGVPTWGTDNNTWDALSTSQAGYVAKAPNDTAKFLRGDASWAAVTKSNVGLGNVDNTADANKRVKGANITTTANAVAYYTDTAGTFGSKASANGALYATSANGALTFGTLPAAQGGTGKTTLKDACNALINALDTGSSNLTANDYVITQYVGGGTTTTTYHRRPASALRVGGLLTARKLKVALGSTTDVTFDGTADVTNIPISGTLGVGNGGTGATTFTSGALLIGNGTSAVGTRTIKNMTAKGNLGWTAAATDIYIPTVNTLAYWNGAYSGTSSNLTYCNQGAFGTAATYTATTSITSGGTGLPTAGAVYTAINNLSSSYVSLNGNEGILGTKIFGSGTSYGTVTNKTTYTEKANINYNSTLEAIVFSFA